LLAVATVISSVLALLTVVALLARLRAVGVLLFLRLLLCALLPPPRLAGPLRPSSSTMTRTGRGFLELRLLPCLLLTVLLDVSATCATGAPSITLEICLTLPTTAA
jgi:hypothetical protein